VARQLAQKIAAMPVRSIHHRCDAKAVIESTHAPILAGHRPAAQPPWVSAECSLSACHQGTVRLSKLVLFPPGALTKTNSPARCTLSAAAERRNCGVGEGQRLEN